MNTNNLDNLKIEYTIISRGTEKSGSKGYMGVTESFDNKRYFVLANHYDKYVENNKDAFCFSDEYTIENIALTRFELITKLALQHHLDFVKEKILIYGMGSVGFSSLIYLLDMGYKNIDICVRKKSLNIVKVMNKLNNKYSSSIKVINNLMESYNTYIDTTGSGEAIENVFRSIGNNSAFFLIGTPRDNKYFINPLEIHRKNLRIFGGHELNGHNWNERNEIFLELLKLNENKDLKEFVNIYKCDNNLNIPQRVYEKKSNFFEVIKYDLFD